MIPSTYKRESLISPQVNLARVWHSNLRTMKLTRDLADVERAENVPPVEQLEQALGDIDYEILIVDDDSPDQTWSIAQKISLINPRVRVLRRTRTGAWHGGDRWILHCRRNALACIDADLQHDPSDSSPMLKNYSVARMSCRPAATLRRECGEMESIAAAGILVCDKKRRNFFSGSNKRSDVRGIFWFGAGFLRSKRSMERKRVQNPPGNSHETHASSVKEIHIHSAPGRMEIETYWKGRVLSPSNCGACVAPAAPSSPIFKICCRRRAGFPFHLAVMALCSANQLTWLARPQPSRAWWRISKTTS